MPLCHVSPSSRTPIPNNTTVLQPKQKMARVQARVVELFKDLLAKNIREPKGITGRIVLVSD